MSGRQKNTKISNKPNVRNQKDTTHITKQSQVWLGQYPHPDDLRKYEEICPGFAQHLLDAAKDEGDSRREQEKRIVKNVHIATIIGFVFGLIAVMIVCFIVFMAFHWGYSWEAATFGSVIVGVAGVFLNNRSRKK